MISLTKLLIGNENYGDRLRYSPDSRLQSHGTSKGKGPVVVWNTTKSCNLNCAHCYSNSIPGSTDELTTDHAENFIDDLSNFKVPVLLLSGGEPLMRKDIFDIIQYAKSKKIRAVLSTNGTLIKPEIAELIKEIGVSYVGISMDGIGWKNDQFRGLKGAYENALNGIKNCMDVGQKVGLRFTITKHTYSNLNDIFELIERESIPRVCFYHLAYSDHGLNIKDIDVSKTESRRALDLIISKTLELNEIGLDTEILTVDNHADGIYIYNWALKNAPHRAQKIYELLLNNGGNRSGIAIGSVDWNGNVYPDQFTGIANLGNIKEKKFSDIWTDNSNPVLNGFRNRKDLLEGRCNECKWIEICNGNLRARATINGNLWASDPACYLSDKEIGLGG
jgi:Fe-coproporphyrin III synthase